MSGQDNPSQALGFEADIKPLFRPSDREAMLWTFDLWSFADVSAHGTQIAEQLQAGTMPCDAPWPAEHVSLFANWLSSGSRP
jgi:hypothetical protein